MFHLLLFLFFKFLNTSYDVLNTKSFSRFIKNKTLEEILISKKKFFYLWRKKLNTKIFNEKDQIKKITFKKCKGNYILLVKTIHSFKIKNLNITRQSSESLNYIFILSKFKITHMAIKEYNPLLYQKLLHNSINLNNIDINKYIINWSELLENIDSLSNNYLNSISSKAAPYRNITHYNRSKAILYAKKYALKYNTYYTDFNNNGGDCTNYISQCLHAGNLPLSRTWTPYTTPWIRVNELYYYLINNNFAYSVSSLSLLEEGDLIQFYSNTKGFYAHSGIITTILDNGEILYSCHTFDKLDYPLSEIYPSLYNKLRLLKISF